ncbi:hypothetical protein M378DRAFT_181833 [Amanita muscaria Koide BX008]|uniref:Ribonuclease H1 N-terminal domain-containing protein n=1 Tax=Amanita muscaria (strain Koide BX008) TaxID=946122 RepID=A0A0C2S2H5_AMAMK|nr:hypothetical protein M378DRAFT_181833 [Amanita muscaria Koide BX008]
MKLEGNNASGPPPGGGMQQQDIMPILTQVMNWLNLLTGKSIGDLILFTTDMQTSNHNGGASERDHSDEEIEGLEIAGNRPRFWQRTRASLALDDDSGPCARSREDDNARSYVSVTQPHTSAVAITINAHPQSAPTTPRRHTRELNRTITTPQTDKRHKQTSCGPPLVKFSNSSSRYIRYPALPKPTATGTASSQPSRYPAHTEDGPSSLQAPVINISAETSAGRPVMTPREAALWLSYHKHHRYYVVTKGPEPGIYVDWHYVAAIRDDYPRAIFTRQNTAEDALRTPYLSQYYLDDYSWL